MSQDINIIRNITRLASRGWVSLNECAGIIDVSYPTMLAMRNRGDVQTIKVGGIYRVYQDELVRLLTKGNYVPDNAANILAQLSGESSDSPFPLPGE